MTTNQLINIAESLELRVIYDSNNIITIAGINGQVSVLYTNNSVNNKPSTMKDFANHLKQMGRDQLKMDLERLLNITTHG